MKINYKLLLDVDGVLADFNLATCTIHNLDYNRDNYSFTQGHDYLLDLYLLTYPSKTKFDFYSLMDYNFWSSLPLLSDAYKILNLVESFFPDRVSLCTSPIRTPGCIEGKLFWISKYFPKYSSKYIITPSKHLLASSEVILIDDRDKVVNDFSLNNGLGILLPRPWNFLYNEHPLSYLSTTLLSIIY